jgi:hypothetical protein
MSEEQMNLAIRSAVQRTGMSLLQWLFLTAFGLLALQLALAFPAHHHTGRSWRERDHLVCFYARQLFERDLEELSEAELDDAKRWCRCMQLIVNHEMSGVQSLTDEECRFVVDALDDLCPNVQNAAGYRRVYESCSKRLAVDSPPTTLASKREPYSSDARPMLE